MNTRQCPLLQRVCADMYALGVVLWELATGLKPYHKLRPADLMAAKQLPTEDVLTFPPDVLSRLPPDYPALCRDCWRSAEQRPTAAAAAARMASLAGALNLPPPSPTSRDASTPGAAALPVAAPQPGSGEGDLFAHPTFNWFLDGSYPNLTSLAYSHMSSLGGCSRDVGLDSLFGMVGGPSQPTDSTKLPSLGGCPADDLMCDAGMTTLAQGQPASGPAGVARGTGAPGGGHMPREPGVGSMAGSSWAATLAPLPASACPLGHLRHHRVFRVPPPPPPPAAGGGAPVCGGPGGGAPRSSAHHAQMRGIASSLVTMGRPGPPTTSGGGSGFVVQWGQVETVAMAGGVPHFVAFGPCVGDEEVRRVLTSYVHPPQQHP